MRSLIFLLSLLFLGTSLLGCAPGQRYFDDGRAAFDERRYEEALALFEQALQKEPQRQEYRMMALSARQQAAVAHLRAGNHAQQDGDLEGAESAYLAALALSPEIPAAREALKNLRRQKMVEDQLVQARSFQEEGALKEARQILRALLQVAPTHPEVQNLLDEVELAMAEAPTGLLLPLASRKPISIEFQATELLEALKILSRLSGINFVPEAGIQRQRVHLNLYDVTPAQALEVLLRLNDLEAKPLNDKTLLIYPNSKENEALYADYKVQTFYLSHITAKKAVNLLRLMLKTKTVFVHEERNALVLRDRPEVLEVAARILRAADRAEAEVMFEVEVIEVSHNNNQLLGPQLSPYSISGGFEKGGSVVASSINSGESAARLVTGLSSLETVYTLPTATFDFQKTLVDTEILASPKVRVKDGAKAKVHIGTREPVITVTSTGETVSENVQYIDVGVKLDIEPKVDLDQTVVTKLKLEVSNVIERTETDNGTLVLSISTTNAESTLILKDGERTVVGGLIRDDKTKTRKAIALLGDIPLIGDLFSNHNTDNSKREILLSIRPHILRPPDLPEPGQDSTWSGSLKEVKPSPAFGTFLVPVDDGPSLPSTATSTPSPEAEDEVGREILKSLEPQAAQSGAPTLKLFTSPQALQGQDVVVQIMASDLTDLASAVLGIGYDPEALEWLGTEEGPLLRTSGETLFQANEGPEKGIVMLGTKALEPQPLVGDGVLATLTFRALAPGLTILDFSQVQTRDKDGLPLTPEAAAFELEILPGEGAE